MAGNLNPNNDPALQKKIDEARANGYSDEEIGAALNPKTAEQLNAETEKDRKEEYIGMAEFGAAQAAKLAGEGALAYGGYRGLKSIAQNWGAGKGPFGAGGGGTPVVPEVGGNAPMGSPNVTTGPAAAAPSGTGGNIPTGGAPAGGGSKIILPENVGAGPRPNVNPNIGTPQQVMDILKSPGAGAGAPGATPGAEPTMGRMPGAGTPPGGTSQFMPNSAAQQPTAQNFLQRMSQYAQQYAPAVSGAAQKYGPIAGRIAGTAGLMLTPGNVGQNYGAHFPTKGPYAGMEINPVTHRPWTPQELAQYQ